MSRLLFTLVLSVALLVPATAGATEAQAGPSLEVTFGLGGFASPSTPTEISASISSPILVSGRLRVVGADVSVSRPIEVPAGGDQVYELVVPPLQDGTRLTVEILDPSGERIVSETVNVRTPGRDQMPIGVLGSDELPTTLGRVRTVVTDRPVTAFTVPPDAGRETFDIADYVVVTRGAADQAEEAFKWAQGGIRVIVDADIATDQMMAEPMSATGVEGVVAGRVGAGELIVVEGLEGRSADEWAGILRPTPLDFSNSPEWGFESDSSSLLQAASEAGDRQVPSLPWLLFAILGFAFVVGPVNFVVLSRLDKRDWAWVTIPALALLAVGGFWVAGRQRIAGTNLTHASVIVSEGAVRARSAVLVAAGAAGERTINYDNGAVVYPERSLFGSGGAELMIDGNGTAHVDLDQLGFTGLGISASGLEPGLPTVTLRDGNLAVENSELSFWGWGAMSGGASTVSPSELGPGEADEVAVPRGAGGDFGFGFIDSLINQRQLWDDPSRNNSLWPLSQILFGELDEGGIYFVGLTDDFLPGVSVPGATQPVGPTLVLIKAGETSDDPVGGEARASVVDTGFINWLDWGVEHIISTDEMTVRFELPDPELQVVLEDTQRFGPAPQAYEVWDWTSGAFVQIDRQDALGRDHVSPDGQVYVRLIGANEFGDNPMSPASLSLVWETA